MPPKGPSTALIDKILKEQELKQQQRDHDEARRQADIQQHQQQVAIQIEQERIAETKRLEMRAANRCVCCTGKHQTQEEKEAESVRRERYRQTFDGDTTNNPKNEGQ